MTQIWPYIKISLFSMIPTLEGRYAIPWGIKVLETAVIPTYIVATLVGFLPSPFIVILIEKMLNFLCNSKISIVSKFGNWLFNKIERAKHKIDKTNQTEVITKLEASDKRRDKHKAKRLKKQMESENGSFGIWTFIALMIFVSIPLPGTGVWTGAMAAGVLNLKLKQALPPIFIGNIIAGLITTFITIGLLPAIF